MSAPFCNKLCVTFRESLNFVKDNKGVLTGSPIRKEIFQGDKNKGKIACGFKDSKEILFIMGGSLGSKLINDEILQNKRAEYGKEIVATVSQQLQDNFKRN